MCFVPSCTLKNDGNQKIIPIRVLGTILNHAGDHEQTQNLHNPKEIPQINKEK